MPGGGLDGKPVFAGFQREFHLLDSTYYSDIIQLSFGNLPKYVYIVTMLA